MPEKARKVLQFNFDTEAERDAFVMKLEQVRLNVAKESGKILTASDAVRKLIEEL